MYRTPLLAGALFAAFTTGATAQQLNGGELELTYRAFDENDLNATKLSGNAEFGLSRSFAIQADAATSGRDAAAGDLDGQNLTLHGIFHYDGAASFGVFAGMDFVEGDNPTIYGAEAGYEFGIFDVEGYIGQAEADDATTSMYGVEGGYSFSPALEMTASFDIANGEDDTSLSQVMIRGDYRFDRGASVFAGIGSLAIDNGADDDSDAFIQVGATYTFNADRGATFGTRSLLDLLR